MTPSTFLTFAVDAAFFMIMLSVIIAFYRLAKGPTFADRVVALDMMTVLIIAFCGVFAIFSGDAAFLDIVIVLALIGFLATVALARFAERRTAQQKSGDPEGYDG
jgi:multicomponent Na+:H+ antiporter subunit F